MKLLLIRIYYELGVFVRPLELAASLDVKQIQFDSVSYLFSEDMECFGEFTIALAHFRESMIIYDRNESETPDMITQAFKFATFSKIPEFVEFRDKLRNSFQKLVSERQLIRAEMFRDFSRIDEMIGYLNDLDVVELQPVGT